MVRLKTEFHPADRHTRRENAPKNLEGVSIAELHFVRPVRTSSKNRLSEEAPIPRRMQPLPERGQPVVILQQYESSQPVDARSSRTAQDVVGQLTPLEARGAERRPPTRSVAVRPLGADGVEPLRRRKNLGAAQPVLRARGDRGLFNRAVSRDSVAQFGHDLRERRVGDAAVTVQRLVRALRKIGAADPRTFRRELPGVRVFVRFQDADRTFDRTVGNVSETLQDRTRGRVLRPVWNAVRRDIAATGLDAVG